VEIGVLAPSRFWLWDPLPIRICNELLGGRYFLEPDIMPYNTFRWIDKTIWFHIEINMIFIAYGVV